MAITSLLWPEDLGAGTVYWQLGKMAADSWDEDRLPELTAAVGLEVLFTPDIKHAVRYTGRSNNATIMPLVSKGVIDEHGHLCTANEDGSPGARGVVLPATDSESLNPNNWTYTATVHSFRTQVAAFSFHLETGQELDLATVAPVDSSGGTARVVDMEAALRAEAARDAAGLAAEASELARDESVQAAANATAPADSVVSGLIEDEESQTNRSLAEETSKRFGISLTRTHIAHRAGTQNGMRIGSDDYVTFEAIYHAYDKRTWITGALYGLSKVLVGAMTQSVWRSYDSGVSWEKLFDLAIDQPGGVFYENLYVNPAPEVVFLQRTTTGFSSTRDNYVDSFTASGALIGSLSVGASYWLGATQSIDSAPTADWSQRVVMFGEYALDSKETVNIWRTTDLGANWEPVLTLSGNDGEVGAGEVRHCHTVSYDPVTGHWWAAFGDMNPQCQIWRSTDEGLNWELMWGGSQRERTCHFLFTRGYIYYGMDQAVASTDHSMIVRINRDTLEREDIAQVKDGFPVFQLTSTYAPEGFIVWPMCEFGASTRTEDITVQWLSLKDHKMYDLAAFPINDSQSSMEGFLGASVSQDTRDGSIFFRPTRNIQYSWGTEGNLSSFSRGVISEVS